MADITSLHLNKVHINAEETFFQFEESMDISKLEILEIIGRIEKFAYADAKKRFGNLPSSGSINNSRGRWFEMVTAHAVMNTRAKGYPIFKLPSATQDACYVDLFNGADRNKLLT